MGNRCDGVSGRRAEALSLTALFASIGAVFLYAHTAFQLKLAHEALNSLVVHEVARSPNGSSDTAIAISALVLVEN